MTTDEVAAADGATSPGMPDAALDPRTEPPATPTGLDVAVLRSDDAAWDRFVAAAPGGSYPQLSAWAEANAAKGWSARRIVVGAPGGPVGAQVLLHRMRPGPFQRGYATRGPVTTTLDRPAIAAFTGALQRVASGLRLSHVVIDPEVEPGPIEGWLLELGWRRIPAIQIDRTRLIDLGRTEAELWSDLRSSARWSVNKARRTGHTVEDAGAAGLDAFGELYLETARRVGFEANAAFRETYHAFDRDGGARLLLARDTDGRAVATLMLLDCGDRVIERYGASSTEGAAARANYLVKWESIRSSRERGMARYDMWGTDHEGVATFKASFGGHERQYIGAWELVTNRLVHGGFAGIARVRDRGRPATAAPAAAPGGGLRVTEMTTEPPDGWDARVVDAPGGHVMQGTAWAAHRRSQGADPRFVTFSDGHGVLVVLRQQPLSPGSIATVRRGPAHAGGDGADLAAHVGVLGAALADRWRTGAVRRSRARRRPGLRGRDGRPGCAGHRGVPAVHPRHAPGTATRHHGGWDLGRRGQDHQATGAGGRATGHDRAS